MPVRGNFAGPAEGVLENGLPLARGYSPPYGSQRLDRAITDRPGAREEVMRDDRGRTGRISPSVPSTAYDRVAMASRSGVWRDPNMRPPEADRSHREQYSFASTRNAWGMRRSTSEEVGMARRETSDFGGREGPGEVFERHDSRSGGRWGTGEPLNPSWSSDPRDSHYRYTGRYFEGGSRSPQANRRPRNQGMGRGRFRKRPYSPPNDPRDENEHDRYESGSAFDRRRGSVGGSKFFKPRRPKEELQDLWCAACSRNFQDSNSKAAHDRSKGHRQMVEENMVQRNGDLVIKGDHSSVKPKDDASSSMFVEDSQISEEVMNRVLSSGAHTKAPQAFKDWANRSIFAARAKKNDKIVEAVLREIAEELCVHVEKGTIHLQNWTNQPSATGVHYMGAKTGTVALPLFDSEQVVRDVPTDVERYSENPELDETVKDRYSSQADKAHVAALTRVNLETSFQRERVATDVTGAIPPPCTGNSSLKDQRAGPGTNEVAHQGNVGENRSVSHLQQKPIRHDPPARVSEGNNNCNPEAHVAMSSRPTSGSVHDAAAQTENDSHFFAERVGEGRNEAYSQDKRKPSIASRAPGAHGPLSAGSNRVQLHSTRKSTQRMVQALEGVGRDRRSRAKRAYSKDHPEEQSDGNQLRLQPTEIHTDNQNVLSSRELRLELEALEQEFETGYNYDEYTAKLRAFTSVLERREKPYTDTLRAAYELRVEAAILQDAHGDAVDPCSRLMDVYSSVDKTGRETTGDEFCAYFILSLALHSSEDTKSTRRATDREPRAAHGHLRRCLATGRCGPLARQARRILASISMPNCYMFFRILQQHRSGGSGPTPFYVMLEGLSLAFKSLTVHSIFVAVDAPPQYPLSVVSRITCYEPAVSQESAALEEHASELEMLVHDMGGRVVNSRKTETRLSERCLECRGSSARRLELQYGPVRRELLRQAYREEKLEPTIAFEG